MRRGRTGIHLDVMDGHYVPNITFGPQGDPGDPGASAKLFDAHLMIAPVDGYLEAFAAAGVDRLTVHAEATPHLDRTLQAIGAIGEEAGVALNPGTPRAWWNTCWTGSELVLVMTVNPGLAGSRLSRRWWRRLLG